MAGEGKITYADLFDPKWKQQAIDDFIALEKAATVELKKMAAVAKQIKESLPTYVKSGEDLTKLNEAIKKNNALQQEVLKLQTTIRVAKEKNKQLTEAEIRAKEQDKAATAATTKAIKEEINAAQKLANVHKDSLAALKVHQAALVKERDTIDKTSQRFHELSKEILINEKALKKNDEAIGRHQRDVGNYEKAFNGLNKGMMLLGGAAAGLFSVSKAFAFI